ncbi:acetyl-CoA carboxylase biotin carboxyl carrier protein subunit [Neoehrlichia mikurensis]|uniref:Acetyl-CoA carboxylase biotin carboxyl carrier protein subunit n=1 Tax=Neoehrlichia mikurensis TaxID=89586 RepID=A0A9Q9BUW0_9RICK|nr:acetyl-CoA carboxylase biotin carboxyl carrier protein subunit [Neoehrlichia mikurensis]UTO55496.1 acetyl-CoA carboxylase biotin carboxyl carrier protein subunit [Neoehrlichia mikurensis]UTO56418.1 acetyl-CoA carboxylase biotin carboxyl carrier protein subunit [Neoehrlichia mikurensis]
MKVYVKEEEEVQVGQALCVIEAMKMENVICSEVQALVKRIFFTEGSNVFAGDTIIEFYK